MSASEEAAPTRAPRFLPWLRLVRVGTLFSPAADVVAGACLAGVGWSADLARAAVASAAVYAAGMVLNDHADRRQDALVRPERPIPSGRIAPLHALLAGLALLAIGVAISPWPLWWALLAALVLLYDYVLQRRIELGALTMGALRALNLLAGAAFAARAFPTAEVVLVPAVAYALYVVAVTILGYYEDERRVSARAVAGVQAVPPVVGVLALLVLPERTLALVFGFLLAGAFCVRVRRIGSAWDRAAIRGSMTWLLLGTMLYASLLCLGSGRVIEAVVVAMAVVPARWISRRIALT